MNPTLVRRKPWLDLFKDSFRSWMEDKALRLSAALAYYSIFSIAPLLVITIGIAGLVLGKEAVTGELYAGLRGYMGAQSAAAIESMVESASKPSQGVMATVTGFVMLLLGASGVFGQLKDALNTIWGVKPKPRPGMLGMVRGKFLNLGMVLVIGFLLLISLVLSTAIAGLNHRLENVLPLPAVLWAAATFIISLGLVTVLFALIFKVLPDAQIRWRHVWVGALVTAVLFEVGKTGLGWYLGREGAASAYGAAGAVVLLLLWVYYTSCILFFGAEFTQVHANAQGGLPEPAAGAERVTSADRAQQGLPPMAPACGGVPVVAAHPQPAPAPTSHSFLAPFLQYFEARGLLLSLEAKEALQQVINLGIWLTVAVVAIFAGWLLLATALVGLLTQWLGWSWLMAAGVTGGLHLVVAAAAGLLMWKRLTTAHWFSDSIYEFKKRPHMAQDRNNEELKRQAVAALAQGRAAISAELNQLRNQFSPAQVAHRVVDRHPTLVVCLAFAAGILPALALFRPGKCPLQPVSRPVVPAVQAPPKSVLAALAMGVIGTLGKSVLPALLKSSVLPRLLDSLAGRMSGGHASPPRGGK